MRSRVFDPARKADLRDTIAAEHAIGYIYPPAKIAATAIDYGTRSYLNTPPNMTEAQRQSAIDYALLARAVYGADAPPPGWMSVKSFTGPDNSFAELYMNQVSGQYVLAFRGTQATSLSNWETNFKQGIGISSAAYEFAINLVKKLKSDPNYTNLQLVGHSLGGGLATAASLVTGLKATVFNPAGVNARTIAQYVSLDQVRHVNNVTAYCVDADVLTSTQGSTIGGLLIPTTVGRVVVLYSQQWYDPVAKCWLPTTLALGVKNHLMDSVLAGLGYKGK